MTEGTGESAISSCIKMIKRFIWDCFLLDFFWQYRSACAKTLYILFVSLLPGMVVAQESNDFDRPGIYAGLGGTYGFHWFYGKAFDDNLGGRGVQVLSSSSWGLNARDAAKKRGVS